MWKKPACRLLALASTAAGFFSTPTLLGEEAEGADACRAVCDAAGIPNATLPTYEAMAYSYFDCIYQCDICGPHGYGLPGTEADIELYCAVLVGCDRMPDEIAQKACNAACNEHCPCPVDGSCETGSDDVLDPATITDPEYVATTVYTKPTPIQRIAAKLESTLRRAGFGTTAL